MTIAREVRRRQRDWAAAHGISIDQNGYVINDEDNLYLPLSPGFVKALGDGGGGELQDQRDRPAKIRALHSSAVLAINVFQYWEGRKGFELPNALGLDGELAEVLIERQFPSGLRGTSPTLDVVLRLSNDRIVAIESKFTEWMSSKRVKLDDFSSKYLKTNLGHWSACNLQKCQQLANDIASGKEVFRQLDALQLLKHALGLQNNVAGKFSLLYLYYKDEGESDIAGLHSAETARFDSLTDDCLGFKSLSYQQLLGALSRQSGINADYIGFLRERYFPS